MAKIRDKQPDADAGRVKVDEQLEGLEARLTSIYTQTGKELESDLSKFLERFEKQDAEKKSQAESGDISEDDYKNWRERQIFRSDAMKAKISDISARLVNVDKQAMSMVNNQLPETYATSYNFGGFRAEKQADAAGFDFTQFTIINQDAVKTLANEDPDLIPWKPDVDVAEDEKWNRKHVQEAIQQGIVKGDSMDDVAKRLLPVVNMDKNAAIRTARTAVNGIENKGRKDALNRVKEAGVPMVEYWSCTHDSRTRDTHVLLDGTLPDDNGMYGKGIISKLMAYPGDPAGDPAEVYNCRCGLVSTIKGIDHSKDDELYAQMMEEEYFDDWVQIKDELQAKEEAFEARRADLEKKQSEKETEPVEKPAASKGHIVEVTTDDWENWALDPEIFQAALNGTEMPNRSAADGHIYTEEEKQRAADVAVSIQDLAERSEVDEATLFRGESYATLEEAQEKYQVGKTIINDKLTSYTTDSEVAEEYSQAGEYRDNPVRVIITNTNINNDMVGSVGVMTDPLGVGGSAEVITPKGMESKIFSVTYDDEDNVLYVGMTNTARPVVSEEPEKEPEPTNLSDFGLEETTEIDSEVFNYIDSRYGKYQYELAQEMEEFADEDMLLLKLEEGDKVAYAAIDPETNSLEGIVSTGGGQGTELLGRVMEYQESQGEGLMWLADNPESVSYYEHLGLGDYGKGDKNEKLYEISAEDMSEALEKVNEHRDLSNKEENKNGNGSKKRKN